MGFATFIYMKVSMICFQKTESQVQYLLFYYIVTSYRSEEMCFWSKPILSSESKMKKTLNKYRIKH